MKEIFMIITSFLLIVGMTLGAVLVLILSVNAIISVPLNINFGSLLIGEEKTRNLFIVNSTVTDPVMVQSICDKPNSFTGIIVLPVGSSQSQFNFANNGTTIIANNISNGNVQLKVRGVAQSFTNCTLQFSVSNTTNITWVDSVG